MCPGMLSPRLLLIEGRKNPHLLHPSLLTVLPFKIMLSSYFLLNVPPSSFQILKFSSSCFFVDQPISLSFWQKQPLPSTFQKTLYFTSPPSFIIHFFFTLNPLQSYPFKYSCFCFSPSAPIIQNHSRLPFLSASYIYTMLDDHSIHISAAYFLTLT